MVRLVPHLIVHHDEVAKIFSPIREVASKISNTLVPTHDFPESCDVVESEANPECKSVSLVREVDSKSTAALIAIPNILESDVAVKIVVTSERKSAIEVIEQLAGDVVNIGVEVVSRGVVLAEDVVQLAEDVVALPHRATQSWWQMSILLVSLTIGSLFVFAALYFVPLSSVNDGLARNRRFLYGVMTYFEFLGLIPWVETCNFALPDAQFSVKARILSVLVGICFQTLFDASIAESWWAPGGSKVFPIPFASIASIVFALPVTLTSLYLMTSKRSDAQFRIKFKKCLLVLSSYLACVFIAGLWAVVFRRLAGNSTYQAIWAFIFAPFRFLCKILLLSPRLTQLNSRRWIIMNFVVDMIFTRVQVSTYPYIDGCPTMVALLLTSVFTLLWRYYSGIDRCAILISSTWKWSKGQGIPQEVRERLSSEEDVLNIPVGLIQASIRDIHQMSMSLRLHGNGSSPNRFIDWADSENGTLAAEESDEPSASDSAEEQPSIVVDSELSEKHWEQRPLYHVVDSVGSETLSTIVRIHHQISVYLLRSLPIRKHLNSSYELSDEKWRMANIYGWGFIAVNILLILSLSILFKHCQRQRKQKLTVRGIMSYIYRDNFWFLFLWLSATGAFACATMINHFGADFSLEFKWLSCRESPKMAWPGCA